MTPAIEFDQVGKMYRLGRVCTGTLSHDLNRWWQTKILRREDPYLKIGETNDRTHKGGSDYVWALKDISFKVNPGEVVGIIGKNGAGKSTLLKLLSNITNPTTGIIKYQGRIASLLEVGTGFHPEMTGRENIYMNGSIMGMTKQEITQKLDAIVDFAGVERYLDTPVKRYSSGMVVRLGFAVAAFLEPDILVVDEVLAVGDAEFQKKALGKMQEVSHQEGRTVLFVSHNMSAVKNLCTRGILLNDGILACEGEISEVIDTYMHNSANITSSRIVDNIEWKSSFLSIKKIELNGTESPESVITSNQQTLDFLLEGDTSEPIPDLDVRLEFRNMYGTPMAILAEGHYRGLVQSVGIGAFQIKKTIMLPQFLSQGTYQIAILLHQPNVCHYMKASHCALIHVDGGVTQYGQPLILDRDGFFGLESINQ